MRSQEVVALQNRETGYNTRFEFVIAVVDDRGVLHQYSGVDQEIATELVAVCRSGSSTYAQQLIVARRKEEEAARERGDTPEMPRNQEGTRFGPAPGAGLDAPKPLVSGVRPVEQPPTEEEEEDDDE